MGLEALLGAVADVDVVRADPDVIVLGAVAPLGRIAEFRRAAVGWGHGDKGAPRIVVVTSADDPRVLVRAIEAGAHSCLVYGHFQPAELVAVIRDAARGTFRLSPPVVNALVERLHGSLRTARPGLTQREVEIMELVAAGLANRAIASRLVISEKTVKNHIHSIYRRLRADGRAHAIARWRELAS
jgi:DNA-binding NarL/FixJ family response regulator